MKVKDVVEGVLGDVILGVEKDRRLRVWMVVGRIGEKEGEEGKALSEKGRGWYMNRDYCSRLLITWAVST